MERDVQHFLSLSFCLISTHTLTWSVTCIIEAELRSYSISTHTLTWSVTLIVMN